MKRIDVYIYLLIVIAANAGLVSGCFCEPLIFTTGEVAAGQWWRVFTHPFIHVSFYHLLLDSAAFFLLYTQLAEGNVFKRTVYVIASGLGSLIAAIAVMPSLESRGFCGLSGIDHGLMVICGLEMLKEKVNRPIAVIVLFAAAAKCVIELISGTVVFGFIHSGMIGSPVVAAHLGGALGGFAAYALFQVNRARIRKTQMLPT